MIRAAVLLLALPSLLMPPGMCVCQFAPVSTDSSSSSLALKEPTKKPCCSKCGKGVCNLPSEKDKPPVKAPEKKPDCCLVKKAATQPTGLELVGEMSTSALVTVVEVSQPTRLFASPLQHVPTHHSPPYITFCTLLI